MTESDKHLGRHRQQPSTTKSCPDAALKRAEAALADAQGEKVAAVQRQTFIDRLVERWAKVHETNHLATLFTADYRRTH